MSEGFEAIIATAQALTTLNADAAREAEPAVLEAMQATASAGTTPTGEAWAPRKGGGRALPGARAALTSRVRGNRVEVRLEDPKYLYNNYGAGGSSQTKDAKRARSSAKRDRATRAKAGEKVAKSKFHAPARQIIPMVDDPVPPKVADAVRAAIARTFERATGGS